MTEPLHIPSDPVFAFWDQNASLSFNKGNVRIYSMDKEEYLFVDQTMYASTTERAWYRRNIIPYAKGRALELGLGLGVASKIILFTPGVTSLDTVEQNPYVIEAYGRTIFRHNILHQPADAFIDSLQGLDPVYDFVFIDHYAQYESENLWYFSELRDKCQNLLRPEGKLVIWIDENLPDNEQNELRELWIV